jgi:hypothetical protein
MAPGSTGQLQAVRTLQMVTDYDVEIAQSAAIYDPIVETIPVGMRIQAQVAPAPSGLWLALVLSDATPIGEVESRDHRMSAFSTGNQGVSSITGPRSRQDVVVTTRNVALNGFLPDGKALVLRTTIDGVAGRSTQLVFVRQEGASAPASFNLAEYAKKGTVTKPFLLIRGDSTALPRAELSGSAVEAHDQDFDWSWPRSEGSTYLGGSIERNSDDVLMDALRGIHGIRTVETSGVWVMLREQEPQPDEETRTEEDPLATLARSTPEARSYQLALTLRRGTSPEGVLARCMIPIRAGARSAVLFGKEHLELRDLDVEVAQSAAVADGVVRNAFDGLHVQARPRTTNSGALALELDVHGVAQRGNARDFDFGTPWLAPVDQHDADRLDVQQTITFPRGESGPRRVVLGNTGSSNEALALDVEVTDLR